MELFGSVLKTIALVDDVVEAAMKMLGLIFLVVSITYSIAQAHGVF